MGKFFHNFFAGRGKNRFFDCDLSQSGNLSPSLFKDLIGKSLALKRSLILFYIQVGSFFMMKSKWKGKVNWKWTVTAEKLAFQPFLCFKIISQQYSKREVIFTYFIEILSISCWIIPGTHHRIRQKLKN